MAENFENKELLDEIIIGRVEPHIYAFSTNTIPNYLKVGDTCRPVNVRLEEWKKHYPTLQKEYSEEAKVNSDIYFRDYSVHDYLEIVMGKQRLKKSDIGAGIYFSQEFFKETSTEDVKKAVEDIKKNFEEGTGKYQYYKVKDNIQEIDFSHKKSRSRVKFYYKREAPWDLRGNQERVVDKFNTAVKNDKTNLLMYAVMRFGKTFTSLMCAKKMNAKLVLVVSGKADVKGEWKRTCEKAGNFEGYIYGDGDDLTENYNFISDNLDKNKTVVVFLTLQDLQGKDIKEKHKEVFKSPIDLLIVDETHFAARAPVYGYVLKGKNYNVKYENVKGLAAYNKEENTIGELSELVKELQVHITLHLSGTPYRILMSSEFQPEDIICHCQFSDIVDEQKKWDKDNLKKTEKNQEEEWENPYYGFPQMIRFAFHPSKSAKERLDEYKKSGRLYAFSALLEPASKNNDKENLHRKFINEQEVLELFQVIDGSKEDENVLGFLDNDLIKKGCMCRHIVCVLPYCASCDALEELIHTNMDKFKNLNEYKILNISGVENRKEYRKIESIQRIIRDCESRGQKTLTLTVNRMLTGTTVEEWDTMIYLKDTSSPQEYDQAIFRLQNQYIRNISANDAPDKVIKQNMKPQTLLVDFDPYRVFTLQEQKAQIENMIENNGGNSTAKRKIRKELKISPVITINKNRIEQITASNIMDYVSQYSRNRGVMEETLDIPVDLGLMNDSVISNTISRQAEIGSSGGLKVDNVDDEDGSDLDFSEENANALRESIAGYDKSYDENTQGGDADTTKGEIKTFENKFRTYYARILFYAFLVEEKVESLEEIICTLARKENILLAQHLDIDGGFLQIMYARINKFIQSQLDYKIKNINRLAHDNDLDSLTRVNNAMISFNRLSESEVVTPQNICREMVGALPEGELIDVCKNRGKILDIAGKVGEFATALYERLTDKDGLNQAHDVVRDLIYTIPTSQVAYEFTKKIYKILDLNLNNIATFTSYNFLDLKNGEPWKQLQVKTFKVMDVEKNAFFKEGENMKFDFIIGNPPYQEQISQDKSNDSLSKQLFPSFVQSAINLDARTVILITPSRWFAGNAQDKSFVKLREFLRENNHIKVICNYKNGKEVFPNTEIKGGVNYFVYDKDYTGKVKFTNIENGKKDTEIRNLFEEGLEIVVSDSTAYSILSKVKDSKNFVSLQTITTGRNAFGIIGKQDVVEKMSSPDHFDGAIELRCKADTIRWTKRDYITKGKDIVDKYKVYISKSAGSPNTDHKVIGVPYIGGKASVCTDSLFPIGKFDKITEAKNLAKYMTTKFLRYMVSIVKVSQNVTQIVYQFVPLQNFTSGSDIKWSKSIPEIDQQLYTKYGLNKTEIATIESFVKEMD